jgi:hypothetical protein
MNIRLAPLCAAAMVLAACDAQPPQQHSPGDIPAPSTRAEVLNDTILIEGMPEATTSRLLQSPPNSPLPFSTYVPEGLQAGFEGADDSLAVRFAAAFAGSADPNAYMHVRFYGPHVNVAEARELLGGFLATRVPEADPLDTTPSPQAYYQGDGNRIYVGHLVIATRRDRVFHVLTHYPAEYGDGLAPRFDRILEHWRWDDTGTPLRGQ